MQTTLSKLVNNLSEIYSTGVEKKKVVSICGFIGPKDINLYYKCNKCEKIHP